MNTKHLVIGTRGSDLALYQANFIKDKLTNDFGCTVELKIIKTSGDKIDYLSFDKMEGKGFFTKELEEALLNKEIDLAVHSLKDLMTTQPAG
jgi:porphobilinogen deaminase